jgi:lon-related putative ATP-dependent protease
MEKYAVPVEKLRRLCLQEELEFCHTTEDVPPLEGYIGQERAVRAMQFGLSVNAPGYNIFVAGPAGAGKSTYSRDAAIEVAERGAVPCDWLYLYNFKNKDRPLAVSLPAGTGRDFKRDMEEFINDLRAAVPKAFEGADFQKSKEAMVSHVQQEMETAFRKIDQEALESGISIKRTPDGIAFVPLREGKPMTPEEFEGLSEQERNDFEERGKQLQKKIDETFHNGRQLEKQAKERLAELEKQVVLFAARPLVEKLREKYDDFPEIGEYIGHVLEDISNKPEIFKSGGATQPQLPFPVPQDESDLFMRYKVNLFVDNSDKKGAPVIIEPNPQYYNLFGKIEYHSQMLALSTDFTMVKPGAIHLANGGYLILQAKDVLTDPLAWDALKKALKYRKATVENIGEQYRLVPTVTLKPDPVPLDVKVILIGNSMLYHLLYNLDEDFQKLFKIKVDFDIEMPRSPENICRYVALVSSVCRRGHLRHFDRTALAELVEYGSRLAGDQNKLSTRFGEIVEIINEAAAWASLDNAGYVSASHVLKAVDERVYRSNKVEEKIQEMIIRDKILVDTGGEVVGQVNGLSVIDAGGYSFGRPSRITARTFTGRGGIVNIEREIRMSGSVHSKGVLTLAGYLGGKFAQDKPLSLTAQITFEQVYEGVDGDSASSTELYALLSSLSSLPLRQDLAVTGSVNQHGEIQPIGGAIEKIEGFFAVCKARGLNGKQGVVIPAQNIENLMLKKEVIEAVKEGLFHIYAVRSIEEGIELLTGVPAGEKKEDGAYQEGSVFYLVDKKLGAYNEIMGAAGDGRDAGQSREPGSCSC